MKTEQVKQREVRGRTRTDHPQLREAIARETRETDKKGRKTFKDNEEARVLKS